MLFMGFKIKEMVSMYEFDKTSGKMVTHHTWMNPDPQTLQDKIIIDLWNIKESVDRHRKILEENAGIFSAMRAEELYVAMCVNGPLVKEICGRMYAVSNMISNPEEMEQYLNDDGFLSYVGEQEYMRVKPAYDEIFINRSDKRRGEQELGKTGADSAVESTHHRICYLRQLISEKTPPLDRLRPVTLAKALEDTLNLGIADPTYKSQEYATVVFYNQQTLESFEIIRTNADIWDLAMPVYESDVNVCHTHCCQTNTEQVKLIITRFFEGGDWRGVKKFEFDQELLKINLDLERRGIEL